MPLDTDLHKSAHKGDLQCVKELIEKGCIHVNEPGAQNRTALHRAAGANHLPVIQYLIDQGAAVDSADRLHRTPLHWAAISSSKCAIQLLLEREASLRSTTSSGMNPLMCAASKGDLEVVQLILEWAESNPDGPSPFELCTMEDMEGKAALMLAKEA
ncbi:unnamed protein product, partial [Discosporangium mesarthrocarpum]